MTFNGKYRTAATLVLAGGVRATPTQPIPIRARWRNSAQI